MEQVIQTFKQKNAGERLPVVRLEIDYELVSLHDAMQAGDLEEMKHSKERLQLLREEWLRLTKPVPL
ncbi:hypothetical protein [Alteribacillus iranensis]|nr:hypothetical protein [Alteribacillus iranensis]